MRTLEGWTVYFLPVLGKGMEEIGPYSNLPPFPNDSVVRWKGNIGVIKGVEFDCARHTVVYRVLVIE